MGPNVLDQIPNTVVYIASIGGTIYALSKLLGVGANSKVFEQDGHYYKVKIVINNEIDRVLSQEYIKQGEIIFHYLGTSPLYNIGALDIVRAFMGSNISTRYETRLSADHSKKVIRKVFDIALNIARRKQLQRLTFKANYTNYYQSYLHYIKQHPNIRKLLDKTHATVDGKKLQIYQDHVIFDDKSYSHEQFTAYIQYIGYNIGKEIILLFSGIYQNQKHELLRYFRDASRKLEIKERENTSSQSRMKLYVQTIKPFIHTTVHIQPGGQAYIYIIQNEKKSQQ